MIRRWVFNIAAAVSLILWLLFGVLVFTLLLPASAGTGTFFVVYHAPPHPVLGFVIAAFVLLALIAVVVTPILWLRSFLRDARRRRRVVEGKCPACGYNLTANSSGVCPECGTSLTGKGKMIT